MDNISMEDELGMVSETIISSADKQNHVDHIYGLVTDSTSPLSLSNCGMTASVSAIRGRSKVWNEFAVTPDGKKVACRLCGDCLAYSNSHSTSSMLKHLKRKHNLDLYPQVNGDDSANPTNANSDKINGSSPSVAEKRNRSKLKKTIPKDAEESNTSIQHGPLQFKDPCVRMKWTDHSDTFLRTFSSLYSDESYTDVTLVAEKQYFKAHRVILSSASEFFDDTFKMAPFGQHPIIFLKDIKAMDLRILLDFIYKGEVSIPPSLIPGLVKVGSELRVRGLSDFVWNEQLASNIFQPQPQSSQTTQNAQQSPENRTRPPAQQMQNTVPAATPIQSQLVTPSTSTNQNPGSTASATGAPLNSTVTSPNKIFSPVRAVLRHTQPLLGTSGVVGVATSQPQLATTSTLSNGTLAGVPRTYSRILNIRPTSPGSSSSVSGQFITGDLSAVCSSVASTFPAMKRIRIVTSAAGLTEGQKQVCKIGTDNTNLQTFGENDTATETVLMVTNEGETMLSTTQGGVTVLTPNTSMALRVGLALKETRYNSSNPISPFQNTQLPPHPLTVLTSSESQSRSQELDEVVYSITEIPSSAHEVLMTQDHEMVVCDDSGEMVDKKPFLSP